jgi:ribA/ribD-fused uncharacterized protein
MVGNRYFLLRIEVKFNLKLKSFRMKITERTYDSSQVITFSNTKGIFGGLSNMAPQFSLFVNELNISNSEVLYQSCRFPLFPAIQAEIMAQKNPMEAKMVSRKYNDYTRQDWEMIQFDVMKWCLMVKLIQNWDTFGDLLRKTGDKPIVEYSVTDKVWAASPAEKGLLKGKNALGRLLMHLRETFVKPNQRPYSIEPLPIPAFLLFNMPITKVFGTEYYLEDFDTDEYRKVA